MTPVRRAFSSLLRRELMREDSSFLTSELIWLVSTPALDTAPLIWLPVLVKDVSRSEA